MYYAFETPMSMLMLVMAILITLGAQILVNTAYNKYRRISNGKGITGFEVARKILDKNNLSDVHIVEVKDILGDHFDSKRDVIRLSSGVFNDASIASVAIAAHEASHAVQHHQGYIYMKLRSIIFPIVSLGSKLGYFAIFIGYFLGFFDLIIVGIWLLMSIIIFELVTLPVEYDASNRAKQNLMEMGILTPQETTEASNMLSAAALTYVAAVATSLLQILRLLARSRRRD